MDQRKRIIRSRSSGGFGKTTNNRSARTAGTRKATNNRISGGICFKKLSPQMSKHQPDRTTSDSTGVCPSFQHIRKPHGFAPSGDVKWHHHECSRCLKLHFLHTIGCAHQGGYDFPRVATTFTTDVYPPTPHPPSQFLEFLPFICWEITVLHPNVFCAKNIVGII